MDYVVSDDREGRKERGTYLILLNRVISIVGGGGRFGIPRLLNTLGGRSCGIGIPALCSPSRGRFCRRDGLPVELGIGWGRRILGQRLFGYG